MLQPGAECAYTPSSRAPAHRAALNRHHTHFIFVDDVERESDEEPAWGCELKVRSALEAAFVDLFAVPLVLLVADGGANTVGTVLTFAQSTERNAILILSDSGRASSAIHAFCKDGKDKYVADAEFPEFSDPSVLAKLDMIVKEHEAMDNKLLTFIRSSDDIRLHVSVTVCHNFKHARV